MPDLAKLDAPGRHLLQEQSESGRRVALFVQGVAPFDDAQVDQLRADGFVVRSVAGDVLTAEADVDALGSLTDLGFVRAVQVSAALFTEAEAARPGDEPGDPDLGDPDRGYDVI